MTNAEGIFSHLPPADRPMATVEREPAFKTEQEIVLERLADRVLKLMPEQIDETLGSSRYTDYDRAAYIVAEADEQNLIIEHAEALQALVRAAERASIIKQAADKLERQTEEWNESGTNQPEQSLEDKIDRITLHRTDPTIEDIVPEEPKQEEHND